MSEQKEQRCVKPGCGAQRIVGKPCQDWDCPQQTVHHSDHRAILEAQAAENAELRAEYLNASKDAQDFMARALAAETALATAREALSEIAEPEAVWRRRAGEDGIRLNANDILALMRERTPEAIALKALKTKEPSHG